tara:strand:- start:3307 stop:3741 length:435 start_codon:yes stop_codon:yes gene_type:complete
MSQQTVGGALTALRCYLAAMSDDRLSAMAGNHSLSPLVRAAVDYEQQERFQRWQASLDPADAPARRQALRDSPPVLQPSPRVRSPVARLQALERRAGAVTSPAQEYTTATCPPLVKQVVTVVVGGVRISVENVRRLVAAARAID